MNKGLLLILLCVLVQMTPAIAQHKKSSGVETIVLFRHGEKPSLGLGQLNCQGINRALALPPVLLSKFGKPDYLFGPNPYVKMNERGGMYYYVRPLITVEPTAIQLNMPVNTTYAFPKIKEIARELLLPKYHQSLLFVAWEHISAVQIAWALMDSLGADKKIIPGWPGDDFDSLYVFTIDWSKSKPQVTFQHQYEGLNFRDKTCPHPSYLSATVPLRGVKRFVLIPEAESEVKEMDQLNCQGLNRSLALAQFLQQRYGKFDSFVIPSIASTTPIYLRNLMTIEPTIVNSGLYLGLILDYLDPLRTAKLLDSSVFSNKTIALVWPWQDLGRLAQVIYTRNGGDARDLPLPTPDHDTIYEITVGNKLRAMTPVFTKVKENLNDRSTTCPLK